MGRRAPSALAGAVSLAVWVGGTLLGKHPDGGLLGFAATMFAIAKTIGVDDRQREARSRRRDREEGGGDG